jgi:hypothetical protein
MHPVIKALAVSTVVAGGLAASPANAGGSFGIYFGSGYPAWGYGYAPPPPYWGPPPPYWGPPIYGYGYRYYRRPRYWAPRYGYRRYWRGWHR